MGSRFFFPLAGYNTSEVRVMTKITITHNDGETHMTVDGDPEYIISILAEAMWIEMDGAKGADVSDAHLADCARAAIDSARLKKRVREIVES